ncbi:RluA family pseudouridine synthase [Hirschia baltica]|uniref:Pseudouridine synthase n=1 Tax=Hirschia baltica (strain ATCC 49814 / DSM 5838 / IFAM 1418) TaxID=582402 RepID=C6XLD8_HIRBI|nr:RluA family pseudouridine synthase [Hirschia baltica]ACT59737.1 pseudouridine synthase [Hirschia baltica ATCC 49814]
MENENSEDKPWEKGDFSKKLTKPYQVTHADRDYMDELLLGEDDSILAFNKPSGLACQTRSPADRTFDALLQVYVKRNGKRPRMLHRLDMLTSGVIIAARTKPATSFFQQTFERREAYKSYLAIVRGPAFEKSEGVIDAHLQRYQKEPNLALMRPCDVDGEGAQDARTRYLVLSSQNDYHFLLLTPETGRTHQLRVHLEHFGRPILADPYYGTDALEGSYQPARLMLHAYRLLTPHPDGGEIDIIADVPDDMKECLTALSLENGLLALQDKTG